MLKYLDDGGYNGMMRDEASALLARGQVYDSLNVIYDQPGIARQRNGTTALVSGAQTAFNTIIGWAYSQDATTIEELYGANGKDGNVYVINKTTGAATLVGALATSVVTCGRPVRHFGTVVFPYRTGTAREISALAGQTSATTFTNGQVAAVAAGNQQITLTAPDATTNIKVGSIVQANDNAALQYFGRVVSIDSAVKFTVTPTPAVTFNAPAGFLLTGPIVGDFGGAAVASFQNRLVIGNSMDLASVNTSLIADRRFYYSPLPTETALFGALVAYGSHFLFPTWWPKYNYIDIPGADPIVAMEPIDDSRLLILTSTDVVIFSGNLTTQTSTTAPSVTWDIYPLGTTSGCLSDLSVVRTPIGIMWAGTEGIFAYWPPLRRSPAHTGIRDLTDGHINTYWRQLQRGANFAVHGAFYSRGHYVISGSSGGVTFALNVNVTTGAWGRLSGAGTDIFNGLPRPSNPSQVYVSRFWTQSGAAPSMTNGQTLRVESLLDPYAAGTTTLDGDGSHIALSLTTRVLAGDPETQKIMQRCTIRCQIASPTAQLAVTCQSLIDAADITAASVRSLGNLPSTEVRTLSNATNATPIVCTTTVNHGLSDGGFVDINGVLGNLNANGRWRVHTLTAATFSLYGSSGSAAYTSGGSVKALTETDFQITSLDQGQGVSFTFTGTQVDNFELHGIRVAYSENAPVMSA